MIQGTTYVLSEEPAYNLAEVNLIAPTGKGGDTDWYRFQIIVVMRDDRLTEYRERMGLAKNFTADQFRIIGGIKDEITGVFHIEETVGRLKEMANQLRAKPIIDKREIPALRMWRKNKKLMFA